MIQRIYNNSSYYTKLRLPTFFSERYLIRWQPNHYTNLHSHNGKKCYFYLLHGSLKEIQFKNSNNDIININVLNKFLDKGYIDDNIGKHIVSNLNNKITYTYHVYK